MAVQSDTTKAEASILDDAVSVFRTHGFVGASIQRLVDATGKSRSSLYARYGDKDGLFVAALQRYLTTIDTTADQSFDVQLRGSIDSMFGTDGSQPCLLARSCAELADLPPEAIGIVESALEDQWMTMIDSPTAAGSSARGTLALAVRHGLTALAAAGVPNDILHEAIDEFSRSPR